MDDSYCLNNFEVKKKTKLYIKDLGIKEYRCNIANICWKWPT